MHLRRDAAAAAAEFVLAAERVACAEPGLVATVGELNVPRRRGQRDPGPRRRRRSTSATRTTPCASAATAELRADTDEIARAARRAVDWSTIRTSSATTCTPALVERVAEAVAATGIAVRRAARAAPGTTR